MVSNKNLLFQGSILYYFQGLWQVSGRVNLLTFCQAHSDDQVGILHHRPQASISQTLMTVIGMGLKDLGHGGSPGFTQRFHKLHQKSMSWAVRTARISIYRFNCSIPLFKWMDVAFGMRASQIVLFYNHSPWTSEAAVAEKSRLQQLFGMFSQQHSVPRDWQRLVTIPPLLMSCYRRWGTHTVLSHAFTFAFLPSAREDPFSPCRCAALQTQDSQKRCFLTCNAVFKQHCCSVLIAQVTVLFLQEQGSQPKSKPRHKQTIFRGSSASCNHCNCNIL